MNQNALRYHYLIVQFQHILIIDDNLDPYAPFDSGPNAEFFQGDRRYLIAGND